MGHHEELESRFKAAMKAKDEPVLDVIRMIRSRVKKAVTVDGRELGDELYLEIIRSYVKQMTRAIEEYEAAGERGAENAAKLRFEVDYLSPLLPQMMDDDELRRIIRELIKEGGLSGPKQAGRAMGLFMKAHKGKADPATVKRIAEEELQ